MNKSLRKVDLYKAVIKAAESLTKSPTTISQIKTRSVSLIESDDDI